MYDNLTEDILLRNVCHHNFYYFFLEFWETVSTSDYVDNWHIKLIAEELQVVYETWESGEGQLDMLNELCPGTSKTTEISQLFAVWLFIRNPKIRILFASYALRVSEKISDKTRDCIKSAKFKRLFGNKVKIRRDVDGKGYYQLTAGGDRFTTSTDGSATGIHADFIFIDDGINAQEAFSEPAQEAAGLFVTDTVTTRKTDKKRTVSIYTGQRTSSNDPQAKLREAKKGKLNIICLPAELTPETRSLVSPQRAIAYYEANDNLLDKNRLDREVLAEYAALLGPYSYAAQFLQNPLSEDGGIVKRDMIQTCQWSQFNALTKDEKVVWEFDCDTAYGLKKKDSDPSALMASYYSKSNNTLFIRDAREFNDEFDQLLESIQEFITTNEYNQHLSTLWIEPKANGINVVQSLKKNTNINVQKAATPQGDKRHRLISVMWFIAPGRVCLIDGSWNQKWINSVCAFPNSSVHDEFVDLLTQKIARMEELLVPAKKKMRFI
ncbi:hypothetical protein [Hymenobacter sublimis]|uniref:Terminase n=1 Tax=Hymenobacter sublimis TaxID=2933777 RepID=A0ABY4JDP0_9BACT|nr:hypothetical protein [Hymenobacter sublimis]UPL50551.1 hypothetical protein MWH26_06490 [Hymenobacter sublimis]